VSRVGRKPIPVVSGVKVQTSGQQVTISGPKGELAALVHPAIGVAVKDNVINVTRSSDGKQERSLS